MGKLVSKSDVSGAAIVRADGAVISWHTKDGHRPTQDIDFMLDFLVQDHQKNIHYWKSGMFTESILNYNGHKILSSRLREDMMLMLVLDKGAYLGLTMLDMECCLREMDRALDEHSSLPGKIPG